MRSSPLVALLSNGTLPTFGYRFEATDAVRMDRLLEQASAESGATIFEAPMIRMVEIPSASMLYLFTRDGHFAHRSAIVRRVAMTETGRAVETIGFTMAGDHVMGEWMGQFRTEDSLVRRRVAAHPPSSALASGGLQ